MLTMEVLTADGASLRDSLVSLKSVFGEWAKENINASVHETKTFMDRSNNGTYIAIMVLLYRGPR